MRERDDAVREAEAARMRLSSVGGKAAAENESEEEGDLAPVDRHTPWRPSAARDSRDPQLASLLRQTANANHEVMVALCNGAYARKEPNGSGGMLSTWARTAVAAGVTNALVLAMDEETKEAARASGVAAFLLEEEWRQLPAAQQVEEKEGKRKSGGKKAKAVAATNHSVSALKFKLLKRILALGYSVLLSDVDVVTLRDPFGLIEEEGEEERAAGAGAAGGGEDRRRRHRTRHSFLKRDSDFEAMSDGWDPATAYGFDDVLDVPAMGWSRYAHSTRLFALNSGLFFVRPTLAAIDVLSRVEARVASEKGSWDQAVFNEVALLPSAEGYYAPAPRVRVMAIGEFMNSKILFTQIRHELKEKEKEKEKIEEVEVEAGSEETSSSSSSQVFPPASFPLPVMVHVNYHPDKHERMRGVVRYFLGGDREALEGFPDGSEW